jgi:purine-binding chemotaxis protein CheW
MDPKMMERLCDLPQLSSDSEPEQTKSAGSWRVCLFTLGGELFAIDLRQVREVFELEAITPVPGMPTSLVGVANLRGTVIPLADLKLSLGASVSTVPRYAIVVRHGAHQVGLLIDDVPEIRTISHDDMLDSSEPSTSGRRPFLSGLLRVENRVSGMLEISTLLASVEESATDMNTQGIGERKTAPMKQVLVQSDEEEEGHGTV